MLPAGITHHLYMLQSYSHTLSHVTSMFNYIMQVVKQQGSDNTEGQDDYGMMKPANRPKCIPFYVPISCHPSPLMRLICLLNGASFTLLSVI